MRYRSIDEPYIPLIIREYDYWTLMIHEDQRYLGRCVIWQVREGCLQDICDLTEEEVKEVKAPKKKKAPKKNPAPLLSLLLPMAKKLFQNLKRGRKII